MRPPALPVLALGLLSAAPADDLAGLAPDRVQAPSEDSEAVCRDRIHQVREANGQPDLRREAAKPGEPLLIAAVDQRIGGCSVMVMRNDTADVRPLPAPDGQAGLIPAN